MGRKGEIFFQMPENGDEIEILDSPNIQVKIEGKENLYIEDEENFGEYNIDFCYETKDNSREDDDLSSLFEEKNYDYCNDDCNEDCNEFDEDKEQDHRNSECNDYYSKCRKYSNECEEEEEEEEEEEDSCEEVSCEEKIKAAYKKGFEEGKEVGIEKGFKAAIKYFMCRCRRG